MSAPSATPSVTSLIQWEITAAWSALFAVCAYFGEIPLVVISAITIVALALGWPRVLGLPDQLGSSIIIAAGGLSVLVVLTATRDEPLSRWVVPTIAVWVIIAFVREFLRHSGRPRLLESVSGTVSGVIAASLTAGWPAAWRLSATESIGLSDSTALVVVGSIALAVGCAICGTVRTRGSSVLIVVSALVAGGIASWFLPGIGLKAGFLFSALIGIVVATAKKTMSGLPRTGDFPAVLATISWPVAASGMCIYLVGLIASMLNR